MSDGSRHIPGPVLTTKRLVLRPPGADDFDGYAAFFGSDASAHVGGPCDLRSAWKGFASMAGHWAFRGFGWFTLERRDTGTTVGSVGPHHPPQHADLEIGWFVYPEAQAKGFGFEAAQTIRDWTRANVSAPRIVSYIDPDNAASRALATKLDATTDGTRAAHDPGCQVWVHPKGGAS